MKTNALNTYLSAALSLGLLTACDATTTETPAIPAAAPIQTPALTSTPIATETETLSLNKRVLQAALPWNDQPYRVGKAEQCMNWTREVLTAACGVKFQTLDTKNPWDKHLLGADDTLLPEHADSLAGDELGQQISNLNELTAGDLVFLKNTYGNWAPGVITHVGIALGDGTYIHRMTSNKGLVKTQAIAPEEFASGIRLDPSLCDTQ